jgi:hypothetical protein
MLSRFRGDKLLRVLAPLAAAIILAIVYGRVSAAVTIKSFQAQGEASDILVTWESGSEINNVGYNVLRSDSENGTYSQINPDLIRGCIGCIGGQSYQYRDPPPGAGQTYPAPVVGQTYYYHLESVDTGGNKTTTDCVNSCPHPPSAAAGAPAATPTPTGTPLATPNNTVQPTGTNTRRPTATKTRTPTTTRTPVGTATQTPGPLTPTSTPAAATSTNTAGPSPTKTRTLVPSATVPTDVVPTETPMQELPTETDVPPDVQDATYAAATSAPTKVAYLAPPSTGNPQTSPDQVETATPTPGDALSATPLPESGSTTTALRVRETPVPTRPLPANKSKVPAPTARHTLALTENQSTAIAFGILIVALFGLGLLSGVIGFIMWYFRRAY